MPNFIEIYKYFKTLPKLNQLVFIDMIRNLIYGIESVDNIKIEFSKKEVSLMGEDMKDYLKEVGVSEASGFTVYKKVDYITNKDIAELININISGNISKLSLMKRGTIISLIKNNFIEDLNVGIDDFFPENEMIKQGIIKINKKGIKKLDFKKLEIVNEEYNLFGKKCKLTKENINLFVYLRIIDELKKYYGEEELNKELNMDSSYKQIIFYKADKKILEDLIYKLNKDGNKEIIEKYEFKNNKLYINGEEFKIKDSEKTKYFIELISIYFSGTNKKILSISELNDLYIKDTKDLKYLTLTSNNIKTSYIKIIRKHLGKKYINNEILKIKGNDIVLL